MENIITIERCTSDTVILSYGSATAYSTLWWPPSVKDCAQSLSSDPKIKLEYHDFLPFLKYFFRNLHKLESLTLTRLITRTRRVRERIETHTRTRVAATTHTQVKKRAHETMQRSHSSKKCSYLNRNESNACLRSLVVVGCSMEDWYFSPCA
jgi:hypothetical protein